METYGNISFLSFGKVGENWKKTWRKYGGKYDCKLAKSIATLFQRSLLCSPCSLSVGGNKACIQFRVFIELVNFHVPFAFLVSRLRKKLISQVSCSVEKIETGGICHG